MRVDIKYDAIIVYETEFQKTIVDKLIPQYFQNANLLLIDGRNNKLRIDDAVYEINFGGIRSMRRSISEVRRLPRLRTKELVGTHITGINCRIYETLIEYDSLSFLDDGIGTPALLRRKWFIDSFAWLIRFILEFIILLFLTGKRVKTIPQLIKKAKRYYTIYSFVDNEYQVILTGIQIFHIDYFNFYRFDNILKDEVGYIGSGPGFNKYQEKCLEEVKQKHGKFVYYPHPSERDFGMINKYAQDVVRPSMTIEAYFMKNGIPEYLYGDMSTVFINLKETGAKSYMKVFAHLSKKNVYCRIYEECGIEVEYMTN